MIMINNNNKKNPFYLFCIFQNTQRHFTGWLKIRAYWLKTVFIADVKKINK